MLLSIHLHSSNWLSYRSDRSLESDRLFGSDRRLWIRPPSWIRPLPLNPTAPLDPTAPFESDRPPESDRRFNPTAHMSPTVPSIRPLLSNPYFLTIRPPSRSHQSFSFGRLVDPTAPPNPIAGRQSFKLQRCITVGAQCESAVVATTGNTLPMSGNVS